MTKNPFIAGKSSPRVPLSLRSNVALSWPWMCLLAPPPGTRRTGHCPSGNRRTWGAAASRRQGSCHCRARWPQSWLYRGAGPPGAAGAHRTALSDCYGVAVSTERIAVTTGSSGGFALAFLALFDPGARVAIAAPGYPAYRNILEAFGIETVTIETAPENRFTVTAP